MGFIHFNKTVHLPSSYWGTPIVGNLQMVNTQQYTCQSAVPQGLNFDPINILGNHHWWRIPPIHSKFKICWIIYCIIHSYYKTNPKTDEIQIPETIVAWLVVFNHLEKYEFVSCDHEIPNWMESHNPVMFLKPPTSCSSNPNPRNNCSKFYIISKIPYLLHILTHMLNGAGIFTYI
jgi:hypothetical protein